MQKLVIVHGRFCFHVKIGKFVHASFHAHLFIRNCSRVTFRFTGGFSQIVHGWEVIVSRGKKKTKLVNYLCRFAKGNVFDVVIRVDTLMISCDYIRIRIF